MKKKELNTKIRQKTVAIVIPIYKRELSADERLSLRHLDHYLGGYDKYIIAPKKLNMYLSRNFNNYSVRLLEDKHFRSKYSYSCLLTSKSFYEIFFGYEYILIYQLDCLVFSDQLLEWCKKGYDYIGAPWYKKVITAEGWSLKADCVGNGGFSLRKVKSHLNVLENPLNVIKYRMLVNLQKLGYSLFVILKIIWGLIKCKQTIKQIIKSEHIRKSLNIDRYSEDLFWSFQARKIFPDFNIPQAEIGVSFSFEVGPRYCFEKNNNRLPFGCHAWAEYDRKFWEPYLLKNF